MKINELKPGDIAIVIQKEEVEMYGDIIVITPTNKVLTIGEERYWGCNRFECDDIEVIKINQDINELVSMIIKQEQL